MILARERQERFEKEAQRGRRLLMMFVDVPLHIVRDQGKVEELLEGQGLEVPDMMQIAKVGFHPRLIFAQGGGAFAPTRFSARHKGLGRPLCKGGTLLLDSR